MWSALIIVASSLTLAFCDRSQRHVGGHGSHTCRPWPRWAHSRRRCSSRGRRRDLADRAGRGVLGLVDRLGAGSCSVAGGQEREAGGAGKKENIYSIFLQTCGFNTDSPGRVQGPPCKGSRGMRSPQPRRPSPQAPLGWPGDWTGVRRDRPRSSLKTDKRGREMAIEIKQENFWFAARAGAPPRPGPRCIGRRSCRARTTAACGCGGGKRGPSSRGQGTTLRHRPIRVRVPHRHGRRRLHAGRDVHLADHRKGPPPGRAWRDDLGGRRLQGRGGRTESFAELELDSIDHPFALPRWVAAEVTDDLRYRSAGIMAGLWRGERATPAPSGVCAGGVGESTGIAPGARAYPSPLASASVF